MDTSNDFRFNGVDPFDDWIIIDNCLYGYYPRNSIIHQISKLHSVLILDNIIKIPEGVTSIRGSSFRNNKRYKEIYIPISISYISDKAFTNSNITLRVVKDSYAYKYAKKHKLKYKYIEEEIV